MLYLLFVLCLDIVFVVSNVVRYLLNLIKEYWVVLKRILWYFKGIVNYGIFFICNVEFKCVGFFDVDWIGDVNDWKLIFGYLF